MDILGSIYEAKIIEQQITYYILKENYEYLETGVVTEGLKEAGNWIKEKAKAFARKVKEWLDNIWDWLKKIGNWIKDKFNALLRFLGIKKKAAQVDGSKLPDDEKKKVAADVKKLNSANTALILRPSAAPILSSGSSSNNSSSGSSKSSSSNYPSTRVKMNQIEDKRPRIEDKSNTLETTAEEFKKRFIKAYTEKKNKENDPIIKNIYSELIKNAEQGKQILLKIAGSDENGEADLFDIDLAQKAINQRMRGMVDAANEALKTRNDNGGVSAAVPNIDDSTADQQEQETKNIYATVTLEDILGKDYITLGDIKNSVKPTRFKDMIESLASLIQLSSKAVDNEANKLYKSVQHTCLDMAADLQDTDATPGQTKVIMAAINGMMSATTYLYNDFVGLLNYTYSSSCSYISKMG